MPQWLGDVALTGGPLPILVPVLALTALLVAAIARPRRMAVVALGALAGAFVGLAIAWITTQPLNLFDVTLSPVSLGWIGGAFAAVGAAVTAIVQGRTRRRVAAGVAIVLALGAGTLGVNADFGQYTTVGSLVNAPDALPLPAAVAAAQAARSPGDAPLTAAQLAEAATDLSRTPTVAGAPLHGEIARVEIPATVSHFPARTAYLYLPPAALVADPPRLPVLIMLSGQPGAPQNVMDAGQMARIMNAFAAAHGGRAPIVVAADQLGSPAANPMCVDSALGNAATYLTVDVPAWIRTHLAVEPQPAAWAIGGFSEGGTCAIQLGAGHPQLFRSIIDVAGQRAPANGSVTQTIARGFHGDGVAYRAAIPAAILAANAPYEDEVAVFGSGALDSRYGPEADEVAAAARAAGIRTTRVISPGTSHDWHTVQWVLGAPSAPVWRHLGLEGS